MLTDVDNDINYANEWHWISKYLQIATSCMYSESNVAQTRGKTVYLFLATDPTNYVTPRHIKYVYHTMSN